MWSDALKCNKMWMLSNERSQAYHMSRYITLNLLYKVQQLNKLLYIELSTSFLIGWKHTVNFLNQHPWCHNCTLYNYQTLKVTGYHAKFTQFVLFPVSEEAKSWLPFFFCSMYNKTITSQIWFLRYPAKMCQHPAIFPTVNCLLPTWDWSSRWTNPSLATVSLFLPDATYKTFWQGW